MKKSDRREIARMTEDLNDVMENVEAILLDTKEIRRTLIPFVREQQAYKKFVEQVKQVQKEAPPESLTLIDVRNQLDDMRTLLRDIEWAGVGETCPYCVNSRAIGHLAGCRIASAIGPHRRPPEFLSEPL